MNKKDLCACVITNIVIIICWTVLAIVFNKWWVALFSILFFVAPSLKYKIYYRYCDNCGKISPCADSYNEALDKAKAAGWIHCVEGNKDYCPDCQQEIFEERASV